MNITAFRKNGKFFSLLMAGVIILFVCTQILVSDSLKVRETISDNHMQISNFTDLFKTVTALRKFSNEFEEDTLIITTKIQKSSLHISLAALLEMIAANFFLIQELCSFSSTVTESDVFYLFTLSIFLMEKNPFGIFEFRKAVLHKWL